MNAPASISGPWTTREVSSPSQRVILVESEDTAIACVAVDGPDDQLHARLIKAAPDHALIARALCMDVAGWASWGDDRGEICVRGLRHATQLDEFGIPMLTDMLRAELTQAVQS